MQGLMMNSQLTIASLMRYAEQNHANAEIVSVTNDDPRHRYTLGESFARARKLANALRNLGVETGDFLGTFAWNDYRHMEIYYALGGMGCVCHTVNPRLFAEQIEYIVNHAEDHWLFVDPDFISVLEPLESRFKSVKGYIILTDSANMPETSLQNAICYEEFIDPHTAEFDWPELDENSACSMCYTSGTTGNPKGVLYSHRALVLQSYAACLPNAMAFTNQDVVMPIVPMFHVNAWNIPYSASIAGFKMVFPGPKMGDGETLQKLIEEEQVTMSAGVPTIWQNLLTYLRESNKQITSMNRMVVGGAACPLGIMEEFEREHGVHSHVGWGMTELSPLGTYNCLKHPREYYSDEEYAKQRVRAGSAVYGIEMKIVDEGDVSLPHDGIAFGALKVRGPWIASSYFKLEESDAHGEDGWFDTGDVANIDPDGSMQITDRAKDVIKSGGEWISSIDLENAAIEHPAVAEAAVIGIPHPKWTERPLLIVVLLAEQTVSKSDLLSSMEGKVAKWWIPNDVAFVDELPHTATGKVHKLVLRQQFADYQSEDGRLT